MNISTSAHAARHRLPEYRVRLREIFGPYNYRIDTKTGTIRAKAGSWIVFGWVGHAGTDRQLFNEARP